MLNKKANILFPFRYVFLKIGQHKYTEMIYMFVTCTDSYQNSSFSLLWFFSKTEGTGSCTSWWDVSDNLQQFKDIKIHKKRENKKTNDLHRHLLQILRCWETIVNPIPFRQKFIKIDLIHILFQSLNYTSYCPRFQNVFTILKADWCFSK